MRVYRKANKPSVYKRFCEIARGDTTKTKFRELVRTGRVRYAELTGHTELCSQREALKFMGLSV